jgi:hypothetical protein
MGDELARLFRKGARTVPYVADSKTRHTISPREFRNAAMTTQYIKTRRDT